MKHSSLLSMPLVAVVLISISSCGNQQNKNNTETSTSDSTSTTTSSTTSAAPSGNKSSTITTTPQDMMVAKHKVANFTKWKMSYDAHDSMRLANGIHNYVIGRGIDDSNTVLVATKVDDINKAKTFAKSPSLKQAMQKGGVVGTPQISFFIASYQDTATISSDIRSRTTFTVKDWATWQKSFDSGRQIRMSNGLMDRAYGHDADDDHKVTVVVAIMDTAKAYAFYKSDQLKKMRAASGVIGQPERFIYRIVQRY